MAPADIEPATRKVQVIRTNDFEQTQAQRNKCETAALKMPICLGVFHRTCDWNGRIKRFADHTQLSPEPHIDRKFESLIGTKRSVKTFIQLQKC